MTKSTTLIPQGATNSQSAGSSGRPAFPGTTAVPGATAVPEATAVPGTTVIPESATAEVALGVMAAHVSLVEQISKFINQLEYLRLSEMAALSKLASTVAQVDRHADHGALMHRSIECEVAAATRTGAIATSNRIAHAYDLINDYPTLADALQSGSITVAHSEAVVAAGSIIADETARAAYEAATVPLAMSMTARQLRSHAKRLAEAHADRSIDERYADASSRREVRVNDLDDGMAQLVATLGAVEAYAIKDRLARVAQHVRGEQHGDTRSGNHDDKHSDTRDDKHFDERGHGELRTLAQIQADVFVEFLLTGGADTAASKIPGTAAHSFSASTSNELSRCTATPSSTVTSSNTDTSPNTDALSAVAGRVQVSVPALALLDADEALLDTDKTSLDTDKSSLDTDKAVSPGPAELAGYGPIPMSVAKRLAARAPGWERLVTHPVSGAVLTVDRYRPNQDLRRFLGARDMHCRFPACMTRLDLCDLDHTIAAADGGPTTAENLGHLCRKHHVLKHWRFLGDSGWKVSQTEGGVFVWSAPTGARYVDTPKSSVMFRPSSASQEPPIGLNDGDPP